MQHPYASLPPRAFWRQAISDKNFLQIRNLWTPRISFSREAPIVTAGSCFAQHIGRALKQNGFNWFDAEPAPTTRPAKWWRPDNLDPTTARAHGYGIFSFRTGNIYTTSLLRQWVSWATGQSAVPDEIWEADGRFYDPFRPTVEPNGFASRDEAVMSRQGTVDAVARAIRSCEVFVFTLGLTERWLDQTTGIEYPICPGTAAGTFDPDRHVFNNMSYPEVRAALEEAIEMIREINPGCKFLLTVSPVPLTATASGEHVLVATTYSKSTLRSVAWDVMQATAETDYFPSYEIISTAPFRGAFFDPNMRTVAPEGVAHVMTRFFDDFKPPAAETTEDRPQQTTADAERDELDLVCEEELLNAFSPEELRRNKA